MHFTKQPFFRCEKCRQRLRTSLHAHEGKRDVLTDIRHTFKASYLDVLKQSFLPVPKPAPVSVAEKLTAKPTTPAQSSPAPKKTDGDDIVVEKTRVADKTPKAMNMTFGPSSTPTTSEPGKQAQKRRLASPTGSTPTVNLSDSPPAKRRGRPPKNPNDSRLNRTVVDDGIEVVGVKGTPLRRDPKKASPTQAKVPAQFMQLRTLTAQLINQVKQSPRSTVIQCQACKTVLFVSDGVVKLEGHVLGHMDGAVSLCEGCGKRFQPAEFPAHNQATHEGKARVMAITSHQDVGKAFVGCFPDAAGLEGLKVKEKTPAKPLPPKEDPQAKGKAVQREMETRFEARAREYLDSDENFIKCPLKECGATVKVSGVNFSNHVTFHSNKQLFVCLYSECRKKVKDIELHVRLTHPSFTTYEDLRPQFMPYLLRLLDLCFPAIPESARKPKPLPELKPAEMMTPDALLKDASRHPSPARPRPVQNNAGKKGGTETRKAEEILPDLKEMKLFYAASESRWKAYTDGQKLIQCYKCDANGGLSTFLEDTTQLRSHIVQHLDRQQLKCHVCENRQSHLPLHLFSAHTRLLNSPEGWPKLDPTFLTFLNACLPPLPDEPDIEPAKNVPKKDKSVGTGSVATRTFPTQTPVFPAGTRSVGLTVSPMRTTVETQTIDAWTGRKNQDPVSEPQTRAELLLYKIEILDLIEQRVKESRASVDAKLYCRAQGCSFSFVYSADASRIHTAVAYVESHILEKHLSQYLFECLICEKKIPNLNFHWAQYHDDMSIMPWYYLDNRRPHIKKLKTAVGVCFPFEAETYRTGRTVPSTPVPASPRPLLPPSLVRPQPQGTPIHRIPPPNPVRANVPQPSVAEEDTKPRKRPADKEVEVLSVAKKAVAPVQQDTPLPNPRKRGRPPTRNLTPARGPHPPLLTSSPNTRTPAVAQKEASGAQTDVLNARALKIFSMTLRGMEQHVKTMGRVKLICGMEGCKKSMGTAGGTGAEKPLTRDQIELHIALHSTHSPLLYQCLLCDIPYNVTDTHFDQKHPNVTPAKTINFVDLRPQTAQTLLLQMRKCFPRVKIEPLSASPSPITNPPPPTPTSTSAKDKTADTGVSAVKLGSFKVPPVPASCAAGPSTSTTTPARTIAAAILQTRQEKAVSPAAKAAAESDARSSNVSILLSALDPETLSRHLPSTSGSPVPRTSPGTPRREDPGNTSDCAIDDRSAVEVGNVVGGEGVGPMMMEEKQEAVESGYPGPMMWTPPFPQDFLSLPPPFLPYPDPSMMPMQFPHMTMPQ